jgi:hypothetical protein
MAFQGGFVLFQFLPTFINLKENKKFWEELIAFTDRVGNDVSNSSAIVACMFVAAVKFFFT